MELVFSLLILVCLICFPLVISHLFTHTTDDSSPDLDRTQRVWIIVNLLVWAYECFFLLVICGRVKGLAVFFGGGLGDLLYIFLLAGMMLLHIVLLAVFTHNHLRAIFFVILVCLPIWLLTVMHLAAAQGNEENGYMTGGNLTGLYYDQEAYWQRRESQREVEEARSDSITEFESLLRSAERGSSREQSMVARCYALGEGVEQNDSLAVKWCRLAAEAGDMLGQLNLGVCYYNGDCGLDVDYKEAVKWFLKAAEQGDAKAQYLTGRCYGHGEGVEQNDDEAFKWLRLAARQGYEPAQELLRENKQTW